MGKHVVFLDNYAAFSQNANYATALMGQLPSPQVMNTVARWTPAFPRELAVVRIATGTALSKLLSPFGPTGGPTAI